jgi:hypothetical protein
MSLSATLTPQFSTYRELFNHLYHNKGITSHLIETLIRRNDHTILVELYAFLFDRPNLIDTVNRFEDLNLEDSRHLLSSYALLPGFRGGEAAIRMPLLPYIGTTARASLYRGLGSFELMDIFRVLREFDHKWPSGMEFRERLQNSPLQAMRRKLAKYPYHLLGRFYCNHLLMSTVIGSTFGSNSLRPGQGRDENQESIEHWFGTSQVGNIGGFFLQKKQQIDNLHITDYKSWVAKNCNHLATIFTACLFVGDVVTMDAIFGNGENGEKKQIKIFPQMDSKLVENIYINDTFMFTKAIQNSLTSTDKPFFLYTIVGCFQYRTKVVELKTKIKQIEEEILLTQDENSIIIIISEAESAAGAENAANAENFPQKNNNVQLSSEKVALEKEVYVYEDYMSRSRQIVFYFLFRFGIQMLSPLYVSVGYYIVSFFQDEEFIALFEQNFGVSKDNIFTYSISDRSSHLENASDEYTWFEPDDDEDEEKIDAEMYLKPTTNRLYCLKEFNQSDFWTLLFKVALWGQSNQMFEPLFERLLENTRKINPEWFIDLTLDEEDDNEEPLEQSPEKKDIENGEEQNKEKSTQNEPHDELKTTAVQTDQLLNAVPSNIINATLLLDKCELSLSNLSLTHSTEGIGWSQFDRLIKTGIPFYYQYIGKGKDFNTFLTQRTQYIFALQFSFGHDTTEKLEYIYDFMAKLNDYHYLVGLKNNIDGESDEDGEERSKLNNKSNRSELRANFLAQTSPESPSKLLPYKSLTPLPTLHTAKIIFSMILWMSLDISNVYNDYKLKDKQAPSQVGEIIAFLFKKGLLSPITDQDSAGQYITDLAPLLAWLRDSMNTLFLKNDLVIVTKNIILNTIKAILEPLFEYLRDDPHKTIISQYIALIHSAQLVSFTEILQLMVGVLKDIFKKYYQLVESKKELANGVTLDFLDETVESFICLCSSGMLYSETDLHDFIHVPDVDALLGYHCDENVDNNDTNNYEKLYAAKKKPNQNQNNGPDSNFHLTNFSIYTPHHLLRFIKHEDNNISAAFPGLYNYLPKPDHQNTEHPKQHKLFDITSPSALSILPPPTFSFIYPLFNRQSSLFQTADLQRFTYSHIPGFSPTELFWSQLLQVDPQDSQLLDPRFILDQHIGHVPSEKADVDMYMSPALLVSKPLGIKRVSLENTITQNDENDGSFENDNHPDNLRVKNHQIDVLYSTPIEYRWDYAPLNEIISSLHYSHTTSVDNQELVQFLGEENEGEQIGQNEASPFLFDNENSFFGYNPDSPLLSRGFKYIQKLFQLNNNSFTPSPLLKFTEFVIDTISPEKFFHFLPKSHSFSLCSHPLLFALFSPLCSSNFDSTPAILFLKQSSGDVNKRTGFIADELLSQALVAANLINLLSTGVDNEHELNLLISQKEEEEDKLNNNGAQNPTRFSKFSLATKTPIIELGPISSTYSKLSTDSKLSENKPKIGPSDIISNETHPVSELMYKYNNWVKSMPLTMEYLDSRQKYMEAIANYNKVAKVDNPSNQISYTYDLIIDGSFADWECDVDEILKRKNVQNVDPNDTSNFSTHVILQPLPFQDDCSDECFDIDDDQDETLPKSSTPPKITLSSLKYRTLHNPTNSPDFSAIQSFRTLSATLPTNFAFDFFQFIHSPTISSLDYTRELYTAIENPYANPPATQLNKYPPNTPYGPEIELENRIIDFNYKQYSLLNAIWIPLSFFSALSNMKVLVVQSNMLLDLVLEFLRSFDDYGVARETGSRLSYPVGLERDSAMGDTFQASPDINFMLYAYQHVHNIHSSYRGISSKNSTNDDDDDDIKSRARHMTWLAISMHLYSSFYSRSTHFDIMDLYITKNRGVYTVPGLSQTKKLRYALTYGDLAELDVAEKTMYNLSYFIFYHPLIFMALTGNNGDHDSNAPYDSELKREIESYTSQNDHGPEICHKQWVLKHGKSRNNGGDNNQQSLWSQWYGIAGLVLGAVGIVGAAGYGMWQISSGIKERRREAKKKARNERQLRED